MKLNIGGEKMRMKILYVALMISLLTVAVAYAASTWLQTNQNTAVYSGNVTAEVKVDGEPLLAGAIINWGQIEPNSTYVKVLSVKNTGSVQAQVTLLTTGLPAGFNLTWAGNQTALPAGDTAVYALTLMTPAALTPQTYTWQTTVKLEKP